MQLIDISVPIVPNCVSWPGDEQPQLIQNSSLSNGDESNVTSLNMGLHTCTHYDTPHHFLRDGATIETLPPDLFVGECFVANLLDSKLITAEELSKLPIYKPIHRLLLRANDKLTSQHKKFDTEYTAISPCAAQWIVDHHLKLVGIDYLSVEPFHDKLFQTHKILLAAGVIVLEGINLSQVNQGYYGLFAPPLLIPNVEASPARAFLQPCED